MSRNAFVGWEIAKTTISTNVKIKIMAEVECENMAWGIFGIHELQKKWYLAVLSHLATLGVYKKGLYCLQ